MLLLRSIVISFGIYLVTAKVLDTLRVKLPETSVQAGKQCLTNQKREVCIETALKNLVLGAILLVIFSRFIKITKPEGAMKTLLFCEGLKLVAMFFVSDTLFYWSHRLLHVPSIFKVAHKQHHEHNEPIAWTSLYVHPFEFLLAFSSIFLMPLVLFKMHTLTVTLFLTGVMLSLLVSHSGMKLGPINATHHDLHHLRRKGNYGSDIGIWDKLCGTVLK